MNSVSSEILRRFISKVKYEINSKKFCFTIFLKMHLKRILRDAESLVACIIHMRGMSPRLGSPHVTYSNHSEPTGSFIYSQTLVSEFPIL